MTSEISRVHRTKQQAKENYDRLSRWYDRLSADSEGPFISRAIANMQKKAGGSVLEVGCGTGRGLSDLVEIAGNNGRVYGIDLSGGMLSVTQERLKKTIPSSVIELTQADALFPPFVSNAFDSLFMSFTLELFDTGEIPQVLAQCRRVLKPGGQLCVVAMVRDRDVNFPVRIYEWFHKVFPVMVDCRPIYLQAALQDAGFAVKQIERSLMWGLPVETCFAEKP